MFLFRALTTPLAIAVAVLATLGCGSSPLPAPPPEVPPAPLPRDAEIDAHLALYPGVPATRAGDQLGWVLDVIVHRKGEAEAAEVEGHFAPSFLAKVPAAQVAAVFQKLALGAADLAINSIEGDDAKLVAHIAARGDKLRIVLAVDPATGKMTALALQPDRITGPKPASFDEAVTMAAAVAPSTQMLVARLDRGRCVPLHRSAETSQLAIGSTFKLYVLLALADRIAAGKAHWTDELAVRDDWKSLPSGVTQDTPAGTKLTLQTFAERMISLSDNTAADHLLYLLGRPAVEAAVREAKHAKPALDVPFLGTRELFVLKLDPAAMDRYLGLPAASRRAFLDHDLAGRQPARDAIAAWTGARRVDTLEWFASADDLCRAMAALWTRGQAPATAPVLDVLGKSSAIPIVKASWPYIGYKGGSERGVVNMTYLLKRDDGAWFVVTLGFNSAEGGTVDEGKIFGIVAGVIELLAKER